MVYCQIQTTFDTFVGTNGFIDVPIDKLQAFGVVREYHNWNFNIGSDLGDGTNPEYEYSRWGGFWNFDDYYTQLSQNNVTVFPCIQGNAGFSGESKSTDKPVDFPNAVTTDPNSYSKKACFMWQYAARYGSQTHKNEDLMLASGQTFVSGLNIIKYYEDWNEQDNWWSGVDSEFSPEEYAALASADIDGHGNTMTEYNGNLGIKNADPNAKFVMGGLAKLGTSFIAGMKQWFDSNRPNKDWPIDVVNLHHYCNEGDRLNGKFSKGESPESNKLKEEVLKVKNWIDTNVPGTELWISEFGYDVTESSDNRIEAFAGKSVGEIWVEWILRTYLILSSSGVSRATQYMARDTVQETSSATRFQTSGFLTCKDCSPSHSPKRGFYDVQAMRNSLKDLNFDSEIEETESIYVYKYSKADDSNEVGFALWCPTSNGTTISSYSLDIGKNAISANITQMDGTISGKKTHPTISNGKITLDVDEMPKFVRVEFQETDSNDNNPSSANAGAIVAAIVFSFLFVFFFVIIFVVALVVIVVLVKSKKKDEQIEKELN